MSFIMEDVLSRIHFLETLLMFNIESIYAKKGKKEKLIFSITIVIVTINLFLLITTNIIKFL